MQKENIIDIIGLYQKAPLWLKDEFANHLDEEITLHPEKSFSLWKPFYSEMYAGNSEDLININKTILNDIAHKIGQSNTLPELLETISLIPSAIIFHYYNNQEIVSALKEKLLSMPGDLSKLIEHLEQNEELHFLLDADFIKRLLSTHKLQDEEIVTLYKIVDDRIKWYPQNSVLFLNDVAKFSPAYNTLINMINPIHLKKVQELDDIFRAIKTISKVSSLEELISFSNSIPKNIINEDIIIAVQSKIKSFNILNLNSLRKFPDVFKNDELISIAEKGSISQEKARLITSIQIILEDTGKMTKQQPPISGYYFKDNFFPKPITFDSNLLAQVNVPKNILNNYEIPAEMLKDHIMALAILVKSDKKDWESIYNTLIANGLNNPSIKWFVDSVRYDEYFRSLSAAYKHNHNTSLHNAIQEWRLENDYWEIENFSGKGNLDDLYREIYDNISTFSKGKIPTESIEELINRYKKDSFTEVIPSKIQIYSSWAKDHTIKSGDISKQKNALRAIQSGVLTKEQLAWWAQNTEPFLANHKKEAMMQMQLLP